MSAEPSAPDWRAAPPEGSKPRLVYLPAGHREGTPLGRNCDEDDDDAGDDDDEDDYYDDDDEGDADDGGPFLEQMYLGISLVIGRVNAR